MKGFYNRLLTINLDDQSFAIETIEDSILETYLGGKGLASFLLFDRNPPGIDPLAPDNNLVFATGPITASSIWGSCRYGVYTKSPQTGFYAESYSGGKAAEAIDATGYDAIVITGKCKQPTILGIFPDEVRFHPAQDIWGRETYRTEDLVIEKFRRSDENYRKPGAVVIGPAAENLVCFGVIKNDYWRSAGRTGVGTVMGSKLLKAILFQGDRKRPLEDPEWIRSYSMQMIKEYRDHPAVISYKTKGTTQMIEPLNKAKAFPTRYWSESRFEHWKKINSDVFHSRCDVKPNACLKCFMACGRKTTILEGRHAGLKLEGPEYETIYAFGGLCMIDSIEEIAYLNDICDRLGMDTISAGNLCAFTIEAVRHNRVNYEIDYGNVDAIADLLKLIATREGIGDILARGIKYAARKWDLEDLAVHVKGMEPPGYEPRALKGMGLAYAASDRGACHLRTTFYKPELAGIIKPEQIEGKAELFLEYEHRLTIFDTLVFCRFFRDFYPWEELQEIIRATTGLKTNTQDLKIKASAISTLIRRFNLREGLQPQDDRLPQRFFKKIEKTGQVLEVEEFETMLKEYFLLQGWDEDGIPPETL